MYLDFPCGMRIRLLEHERRTGAEALLSQLPEGELLLIDLYIGADQS